MMETKDKDDVTAEIHLQVSDSAREDFYTLSQTSASLLPRLQIVLFLPMFQYLALKTTKWT